MIQIAEEFVEAVDRRQILVQVAEVVLAELAGGVALCFERGGERAGFFRDADIGTGLADGGEARTEWNFAGDEVRATCRATGFGVIVGEHHSFGGQLVEVWRFAGHDALVIGADVKPTHVVAHDDDNVGFLSLGVCGGSDPQ